MNGTLFEPQLVLSMVISEYEWNFTWTSVSFINGDKWIWMELYLNLSQFYQWCFVTFNMRSLSWKNISSWIWNGSHHVDEWLFLFETEKVTYCIVIYIQYYRRECYKHWHQYVLVKTDNKYKQGFYQGMWKTN